MNLIDIIGTTAAISPRTGQKAYDFVSKLIESSQAVTISFNGVKDCTSAFCNSFIGKLYMNFSPDSVDSLLHFEGLSDHELWQKKVHNAKLLGTNENLRSVRQANIDDLILS